MSDVRSLLCALVLTLAASSALARAEAPHPPARIVSLNQCLDAILVELAPTERIAAISHYSRDPLRSPIGPSGDPSPAGSSPLAAGQVDGAVGGGGGGTSVESGDWSSGAPGGGGIAPVTGSGC